MGAAVWLDLECLMALPLDPVARATLWRELLTLVPVGGERAGQDQLCDALELRLLEHELDRCRNLGHSGEWLEALQRLDALLPQLEQGRATDAPDVLLDLITGIHQAIVREERPIATDERAELLWQAHRWLLRGGALELPPHDWLSPIREQICRFGALAWLDQTQAIEAPELQAIARHRAQGLLIDLASFWNPCPDWISHYLLQGLRSACEPANRSFHPPGERVGWAQALARLAPEAAERVRLEALLGPALAAIEVGRVLRLSAFSPPSAVA